MLAHDLPRDPLEDLLPQPRRVARLAGGLALGQPLALVAPEGLDSPALEALRAELARAARPPETGARAIRLALERGHPPEGYGLRVEPQGVLLTASTMAGLAHGARTLVQLLRSCSATGAALLPALLLEDAPALARRGVMLDVSRDRVPRMDELFRLVEQLAEWKLNELQLYFEHAFAYRAHEVVWKDVDPFTADELRALDRHCRRHGIELVPNQQSFGHLHHWLKHPRYRHLAELPQGLVHPFLGAGETQAEPFSLCPTDPRSLALLAELYDELLPCFSSGDLNVGLDETIDLGSGRSAEAIAERGVGRVYLDFLRAVHGLVAARGKRMQFWADILLHHAALVPEVPRDALACVWGYEADHPFERETGLVREGGLAFRVCPGTSAWQSLGGRLETMLANLRAAAGAGARHGAEGLMVTEWGDRGHLQPPFAAWTGFLVAADLAWNPDAGASLEGPRLERCLGLHLGRLGAADPDLARTSLALARVARACGAATRNASPLSLLVTRFDAPFPGPELGGLRPEGLEAAQALLARARGEPTRPGGPAALVAREQRFAAGLMDFACALGLERFRCGDARLVQDLPARARGALAERLAALAGEHRELWLERSRPGGLERSARWLERLLATLEG